MARPPMPPGTYETINVRPLRGRFKAETRFRDFDGVVRRVERWGDTAAKAKRALHAHLAVRAEGTQQGSGRELTATSRFADAAEVWLADVAEHRADTTVENYRQRLTSLVLPAIGELRLREITVGRLDSFMTGLRRRGLSGNTRHNVRTVLSGVLGTAVRHGALRNNPVRDMRRQESEPKKAVRALTAAERTDLLAKLDADPVAVRRDLPDFVRFMLGTGVRVGEALAVRWCDVHLENGTLCISGNVVPVRGKGLVRHTGKTAAAVREVSLPEFLITLLRMRYDPEIMPDEPIFANSKNTWRDPHNIQSIVREAADAAGYPWLTTHVFRKTAATILDERGHTPRQIADVLGHARVSLTQDLYMHRGAVDHAAGASLDTALRPGV